MSKGSKPRPLSVSQKQFEDNFDKIFTTSEEADRVKNTLQKALDILDGKDEQGQ